MPSADVSVHVSWFRGDLGVTIISMMVVGDAIVIIEYDRRRLELSNTPLHMKQDNNRTEQ